MASYILKQHKIYWLEIIIKVVKFYYYNDFSTSYSTFI